MVVREDGSKWACTSCLKGHRVSGCNHKDRELHLVPKKGRPITQCQHCRQERKKRSAHVSCDCAAVDKPHHTKEKCIHLREAEERTKHSGLLDDTHHDRDNAHLAAVAEEQGCCCHHGGKCTCALLCKDTNDFDGLPHGKPAVSKPRLEASKSDGSITVFANGHHKPVHRKNHAAHECGMPYKMPMPRSKTEHDVNYAARRSVDSLKLDTRDKDANDWPQSSTQSQQMPTRPLSKVHAELFASAHGLTADKFSFIDFSNLTPVCTTESVPSANGDAFPAFDTIPNFIETPQPDWLSYENFGTTAMPNNNPFEVWTTTADASLPQPALTAASSGTQSEIDEIPALEDTYTNGMPSIQEINFNPADGMLGNSPQSNRRSLPPGFFGNIDFDTPSAEDNWQASLDPSLSIEKPAGQPFVFNDDLWQSSTLQSRPQPSSYFSPGRPTARSVGPASAPSGDIIKQLFPDMDMDGNMDGNMDSNMVSNGRPTLQGPSNSMSASDEDDAFMNQVWADGSMSVPVDPFDASIGLDDDAFGGQDFEAAGWSQ